jgi:MFS transporter, PAT family, beta-lactamase induction signal transducer AmpG
MIVMLILGFSSGLPLALTAGTLQAWMTTEGVSTKTIGLFSLIGLPYLLKFFWSPLMDRFVPPFLGRRRGWIILVQCALFIGIVAMTFWPSGASPLILAVIALCVAFCSASQDIVIDAYRTDLLAEEERGAGSAVYVIGYRVAANLITGGLAFIIAAYMGWRNTYLLMASLVIAGIVGTIFAPEPDEGVKAPRTIREAVWLPFKDLFTHSNAVLFLLAIVLYKVGDAYAMSLTSTFLLRGVGFTLTEVGTMYKFLSFGATIVGAAVGGSLMVRLRLHRSLLFFGFLQMVAILPFVALVWTGRSYAMLASAVIAENFTAAMGTTALFAFLMALCNKRFSATQYAVLSSLASLGRIVIAPTSGFVVEYFGWAWFFLISAVAALPGLVLLYFLRKQIDDIEGQKP